MKSHGTTDLRHLRHAPCHEGHGSRFLAPRDGPFLDGGFVVDFYGQSPRFMVDLWWFLWRISIFWDRYGIYMDLSILPFFWCFFFGTMLRWYILLRLVFYNFFEYSSDHRDQPRSQLVDFIGPTIGWGFKQQNSWFFSFKVGLTCPGGSWKWWFCPPEWEVNSENRREVFLLLRAPILSDRQVASFHQALWIGIINEISTLGWVNICLSFFFFQV